MRLFDLLHGTHWLLLLFGGHEATVSDLRTLTGIQQSVTARYGDRVHSYLIVDGNATPAPLDRTLCDREHFLHDKYGVQSPCLYLIRPDDYVGFRGKIGDEVNLLAYLDRILTEAQA